MQVPSIAIRATRRLLKLGRKKTNQLSAGLESGSAVFEARFGVIDDSRYDMIDPRPLRIRQQLDERYNRLYDLICPRGYKGMFRLERINEAAFERNIRWLDLMIRVLEKQQAAAYPDEQPEPEPSNEPEEAS